ncbi:F-box protein At3g07870-like [Impatiens glandulifera]|uniref:F-box protein At3g07870-like n=1 Tax=Impatiens glandulifera TaxID=253017 RepID=UPI001FB1062A|nr:F-box protein At3g07870-like [Impatiens glandulifera]
MEEEDTSYFLSRLIDYSLSSPSTIDKLPKKLLKNIFVQLPIKSLIYCKCVCKSFHSIISRDPEFLALQLSRSSPELLVCNHRFNRTILIDSFANRARDLELVFKEPSASKKKKRKRIPCGMVVLNSCRGLICVRPCGYSEPLCVFNPFTLEFTLIPESVKKERTEKFIYGFGYCAISDKYKVLKMMTMLKPCYLNGINPPLLTTEIYTLGTPYWRRVEDAPMVKYTNYVPTFLNGYLHWMIDEVGTISSHGYMISFDLNNEKYGQVALPPPLDIGRDTKHMEIAKLGVFEGWLTVFVLNSNKRLDVWAMKEYGVRESWVREITLDMSPFSLYWSFPVNYVNNDRKDLVFFNARNGIFTYKLLERKIVNCIRFIGEWPTDDYQAKALLHVPILMSLKELVVGAEVHRIPRSWKRTGDISFPSSPRRRLNLPRIVFSR